MSVTNGLKKYTRGNETLYALGDNLYTEDELEAMDEARQKRDEQKGYEDRKSHCYDKWYRYSRSDDGAAYDHGVVKCVNEASKFGKKWSQEDEDNFFVIEIAEENR